MKETSTRLEKLLESGIEFISKSNETDLCLKPSLNKWSKKEILGHLIDSGINNLQRFTEIQFLDKPYKIRKYKQNELVIANDYQNAKTEELIHFWQSINIRILNLIEKQNEKTLNYKIVIDNENISNLRFLMKDYVDHLEHHLNQIMK